MYPGSPGGVVYAVYPPGETRVGDEEEASVSDTEENKALVRRFFEEQTKGDLAAVGDDGSRIRRSS